MTYVYVVCEAEGGHLMEAFTNEQDAWSFLKWEEAVNNLRGYTVRKVVLRNWK